MKITKLSESITTRKDLVENVGLIRSQVSDFIEAKLDNAIDNIAIVLASEIKGYNPDWCYELFYGDAVDKLERTKLNFLDSIMNILFEYAPMNESTITEARSGLYAVVNPDETYAGVPCESYEEARDMAAQRDGREIYKLVPAELNESIDEDGNYEKCEECGNLLNDAGECPLCVHGDESVNDDNEDENMNEDYTFMSGNDVISGLVDNVPDSQINSELRTFNKIARSLGLKRADDIICFVDSEWSYDPTYFGGLTYELSTKISEHNVGGIHLFAQLVNGNVWLYFSSEEDAKNYIDYVNNNL